MPLAVDFDVALTIRDYLIDDLHRRVRRLPPFVLAEALTGPEFPLLRLVRGDQLQCGQILRVRFPEGAMAVQYALPESASLRPRHNYVRASAVVRGSTSQDQAPGTPEIVAVLERTLRTRQQRESADELLPEAVSQLNDLVALGVLAVVDEIYRISRLGA